MGSVLQFLAVLLAAFGLVSLAWLALGFLLLPGGCAARMVVDARDGADGLILTSGAQWPEGVPEVTEGGGFWAPSGSQVLVVFLALPLLVLAAVCVANGVSDTKAINRVIDEADGDLRRVKRSVWAMMKGGTR